MAITPLPTPPLRSDPTSFASRGDAFLGALPAFAEEANALAAAMNLNSTTATSTTSMAIGTGAKTLVVAAGKSFQPGMYLVIASTAAPSTNSMIAQVTSYASTTLVVNVVDVRGSGTFANWTISQSAPVAANSGMRNKIINGNFSINQRGVTGSVVLAAGVYGHDRWKAGAGGCTYTFATVQNVTTLTITAGTLMQVIEGLNLSSGSHKLSWSGTSTGRVDAGGYAATGVSGTAVGGTNQTVEFSTGTLSNVQYEYGGVVTPFEQRPYGIELQLCQRYYGIVDTYLGGMTGPAVSNSYTSSFPVRMRATPTISVITSTNVNTTGATVIAAGDGHYRHYSVGTNSAGFISAAIATVNAEL